MAIRGKKQDVSVGEDSERLLQTEQCPGEPPLQGVTHTGADFRRQRRAKLRIKGALKRGDSLTVSGNVPERASTAPRAPTDRNRNSSVSRDHLQQPEHHPNRDHLPLLPSKPE